MSILSLVRKDRLVKHGRWREWLAAANNPRVKCININSLEADVISADDDSGFYLSPVPNLPLTPPFETIWMEASVKDGPQNPRQSIAFLVHRVPGPVGLLNFPGTRWTINARYASLNCGYVVTDLIQLALQVGSDGKILTKDASGDTSGRAYRISDTLRASYKVDLDLQWVREHGLLELSLHALARMNCSNISVLPIWTPSEGRKAKDRARPSTVWHEIKITSVPKIGTRHAAGSDPIEMRSHWVRGHYADYSKGNGLFGNPKLKTVFWMPEHKRGSEEVGEVISSYTIT